MNSEVMQPPQLTNGRLLLLGLSSVILCASYFMSVFAPFPLALAVILYGRAKGYGACMAGLALSFIVSVLLFKSFTLFGFFAVIMIFGIAVAEIVKSGISPIKGMVLFGLAFIALVTLGFFAVIKSQNLGPQQFIVKQIEKSWNEIAEQKKLLEQSTDDNAVNALQLLDNPNLMAKGIMEVLPSYFFLGVFLMLWFNMFLVLKSRRLLLSGHDYPYSEGNLLNFKVPFSLVLVLVLGLVLAIWGNDYGGTQLETIGFTIIKCLGIFYFFQGFGVFIELLNFLGIGGFFRTLIVMLVIFTAYYLIAVAGLFDNWFDFRKYFVKRKTED